MADADRKTLPTDGSLIEILSAIRDGLRPMGAFENLRNPTQPPTGKPVTFKVGNRTSLNTHINGERKRLGPGETITIPEDQAQRWVAQKLGTIVGGAKPIEAKAS